MTAAEPPPPSSPASRGSGAFQSTLWSQVRMARGGDVPQASRALEALCQLYWPPIYTFLRRCGHERQNAKDLTQGFFAYLLAEGLLDKADPARGRFRSFLLGSLKFFVSNQQARERALKRGGGICFVPIEAENEEGILLNEPATHQTPERSFDKKWAHAVLNEAMTRLATEYRRGGLTGQFELLQPYLVGEAETYVPVLARQLGKADGAVRVLLFRLRNRFRRLIRAVIADTVTNPDQVEDELRHLEAALRDD